MDFDKLDALKGFMPSHEGLALKKWAEEFSTYGPALEIGTFGAKSSLYIAAGTATNDQLIYTIDHHAGSEEHQLGEEYFDGKENISFGKLTKNQWNILFSKHLDHHFNQFGI